MGTFITISLFTNSTYDAMRVSPPGIMSLVSEQILFTDPTFTCGVFKLFLPPSFGNHRKGGNYELRMRGSYNTIYHAMCYAEFKKHVAKDFVNAFVPACSGSIIICK
uniref:Lipocalin n=1 Tax=Rhipicephalus zambeziensis TaxID=60191 RepID=A0A224YME2_9ACAR